MPVPLLDLATDESQRFVTCPVTQEQSFSDRGNAQSGGSLAVCPVFERLPSFRSYIGAHYHSPVPFQMLGQAQHVRAAISGP